jgi:hypothetical protein
MKIPILSNKLRLLEEIVEHCSKVTGNPLQDLINQGFMSVLSSPNGSDVQERLIAEACNATHKGDVKLGADAKCSDGEDLEIKPSKCTKTTSSVNITDDTPSRLLKDMETPGKKIAIGRCPGGRKFKWVVVCPMSDFEETRYTAMCKHWNHPPRDWTTVYYDKLQIVRELVAVQGKNKYLRSSTLKFKDIRNILGSWVHPDELVDVLKGKSAEAILMRQLADIQMSAPPMA